MRQMTPEQIQKYKDNPTVIIRTQDDKIFRCLECDSNCFHHPGTDLDEYECNSCHMRYTIEENYVKDTTIEAISSNDFIKKLESMIDEVKSVKHLLQLHYNIDGIDYYIDPEIESDNCGNFNFITGFKC